MTDLSALTGAEISQDSSSCSVSAGNNTPFSIHGSLTVSGTDLVDCNGNKYQLYGMSTHGLAWFPQYVSRDTFLTLRDDWNTNCVRLALYTAQYGGYCTNGDREMLKQLIMNAVDYAIELGMYIIVDWHVLHEKTPLEYMDEAIAFFEEISAKYSGVGNVIYEICNEPNGNTGWQDVKNYAEQVIQVIRRNAPDSVIIVGTPNWSQDIHEAVVSPLGYDNVMYALHFYAATHKQWLRERMKNCLERGLPVFISEFGICDSSGSGAMDYEQAAEWKRIIEEYNISYICWNLANHNESSCVLTSGCDKIHSWTDDDLSEQGRWVTDWFKSERNR